MESKKEILDIIDMTEEERKEFMLVDVLLRVGALEKLLIDKGISSREEIQEYLTSSHSQLAETYLKKIQEDKED